MEKINAGDLIRKLAKEKKVTLYKLAVDSGRFAPSLYTSLKQSNIRTDLMIDLIENLDEKLIVKVKNKEYQLIKKEK